MVFASFSSTNLARFSTASLVLSSMEDKTAQSGNKHILFLEFVLEVFEKTFDSKTALISDNCSTYQSIATKVNKPFLRFASHRFQFFVQELISEDQETVSRVQCLVIELRTLLQRTKLRRQTDLRANLDNDTRWNSVYYPCSNDRSHSAST